MAFLEKIKLKAGRLKQLEPGTGNNQQVRASDFNPIVDYLNARNSDNTSNTVTLTGTGNSTGTINTVYGVITSGTLNAAAGASNTLTVANSNITANSLVLATITAYGGTGQAVLARVVCTAGSMVFTIQNVASAAALTSTVTIRYIIL